MEEGTLYSGLGIRVRTSQVCLGSDLYCQRRISVNCQYVPWLSENWIVHFFSNVTLTVSCVQP